MASKNNIALKMTETQGEWVNGMLTMREITTKTLLHWDQKIITFGAPLFVVGNLRVHRFLGNIKVELAIDGWTENSTNVNITVQVRKSQKAWSRQLPNICSEDIPGICLPFLRNTRNYRDYRLSWNNAKDICTREVGRNIIHVTDEKEAEVLKNYLEAFSPLYAFTSGL